MLILTDVFWHCTEELLKRRAGTLCSFPWMVRRHSYPLCPDCGCGRFLARRVMGFTTLTGTSILSAGSNCGQPWNRNIHSRLSFHNRWGILNMTSMCVSRHCNKITKLEPRVWQIFKWKDSNCISDWSQKTHTCSRFMTIYSDPLNIFTWKPWIRMYFIVNVLDISTLISL